MALRTSRLLLLSAAAVVLLAPAVAALVEPDKITREVIQGEPDPDPVPSEVQEAAEEIRQRLERSTGGDNYVPAPPGGAKGIDDIPGGVTTALLENPALTIGVTLGLIAAGASGWWLASRYVDPTVALRSPERSMLYGFIKGNPGVHLKQLSTEFSMKTSTVLWHVRKLEHADLIRSKKANGYRVFYPVSGGLEASKVSEAVTSLSNGNARSIFAFLAENPHAPLRDVTDRLGINPGTVRWHLKKLHKAGLLEEMPQGGIRVSELGVKAWNQLQGSPTAMVPVAVAPEAEPQAEEITA
jgi:Mn-dependent DtxR family transcriptional regulator